MEAALAAFGKVRFSIVIWVRVLPPNASRLRALEKEVERYDNVIYGATQ
jgi:hypothetical protein